MCFFPLPVECCTQNPCSHHPRPSVLPPQTPAHGTQTPWTARFSQRPWSIYWLHSEGSPAPTSSSLLLLPWPEGGKQVYPVTYRKKEKKVRSLTTLRGRLVILSSDTTNGDLVGQCLWICSSRWIRRAFWWFRGSDTKLLERGFTQLL